MCGSDRVCAWESEHALVHSDLLNTRDKPGNRSRLDIASHISGSTIEVCPGLRVRSMLNVMWGLTFRLDGISDGLGRSCFGSAHDDLRLLEEEGVRYGRTVPTDSRRSTQWVARGRMGGIKSACRQARPGTDHLSRSDQLSSTQHERIVRQSINVSLLAIGLTGPFLKRERRRSVSLRS